MATKTITTTWGFDTGEFGGVLSKGDYDRYMAASISGINEVLNSSGIPTNAKITNVKCTATLKAENKTSISEAKLKIGFGSGSGISNTLLDTVTIFSWAMSGSTTRTVDLSSVIGNNGLSPFQLNTSKGTHLVWNVWIDNVGKKRYQISNIYFDVTYTIPTYTIGATANNSGYGSVTGGGTYNAGTAVTLTATPYAGYKFVQWSDGVTNSTRSVTASSNATYTAQFRPIYISYDSVFSYKMWADTNLTSWALMDIVNKTDTGFTGKALADDAYTMESRPLIRVTKGGRYRVECDTDKTNIQLFVFCCDASGAWSQYNWAVVSSFDATANTDYFSIRCDIDGTGNTATFSNFRIYPVEYPYMSNSVTAAERTGRGGQAMPTPTRAGYKFTGWNTKPDGTGTTYTASNLPNDDIILYSQWVKSENQIIIKSAYVGETECIKVYVQPSTKTIFFVTELVSLGYTEGADTVDGWHIKVRYATDPLFADLKANGLYEVVAVYRNGTLIY